MKTVSEAYILGIKEGREYLKNNPAPDMLEINLHIVSLDKLINDGGFSGDVKDMYKGERDFWRNQAKKG